MNLGRLNHLGVATPSMPDSIVHWRDVVGAAELREPFDLPALGGANFITTPKPAFQGH